MATPLFGRETELAAVDTMLAAARSGLAAVVLEGEPGISKTTVWRAGIARGRPGKIQLCLVWVIEIDDRLLERAKRHAAAHGTTLRTVVEEALRARITAAGKHCTLTEVATRGYFRVR